MLEILVLFLGAMLGVFVAVAIVAWLIRQVAHHYGRLIVVALAAGAASCGGPEVGSTMHAVLPTPTGVDACYEVVIDVWHVRWDLDGYDHLVEVGEDVLCDMGPSCPNWGGVMPATSGIGASYGGRTVFRWDRTWVRVRATDGVTQGPASSPLLRTVSAVCPFPWF